MRGVGTKAGRLSSRTAAEMTAFRDIGGGSAGSAGDGACDGARDGADDGAGDSTGAGDPSIRGGAWAPPPTADLFLSLKVT